MVAIGHVLQKQQEIPLPTIGRLCRVYDLCESLEILGETEVSSQGIGQRLGAAAHNIRKDISCLGEVGTSGAGYNIIALKDHIAKHLGLGKKHRACLVGLGKLGSAILEYERLFAGGCEIVAGFDSSINRLETINTTVPVYPSYEIGNIVKRDAIEIGIIATPASVAAATADDLAAAGIRGIINFAPCTLRPAGNAVVVRNIDIVNEFRILSSLLSLKPAA
jgi:redox-sensing transcriptional repressor